MTSNDDENLKSQFATSSWGGRRTKPYVFTEQGVAMLSAVLKSETAVKMSIQIINAFIAMLDGQIFDAYQFVSDLTRTAQNTILIIDNIGCEKV